MLHYTLPYVFVALHAASIALLALALPFPEINVTDFTITSSSSDVVARTDPMRSVAFTPLLAPLRCIGNNVYCLSIQMANEAYKEFLQVEWGGWSWIEDTPGQEWRTFGESVSAQHAVLRGEIDKRSLFGSSAAIGRHG